MNKSKTLYILVLLALICVALIDHLTQKKQHNQIMVGKSSHQEDYNYQFAKLTK